MDFNEIFFRLLDDLRSVREAESEFLRQLDSEPIMASDFDQWCAENGYRRRSEAIREMADRYLEERESIWQSLRDYDNEE